MRVKIAGGLSQDRPILGLIAGTGISLSQADGGAILEDLEVTVAATAASDTTLNGRYAPQQPALVSAMDPRLASANTAVGANNARGIRVVVPRSGTLTDLAVYIGNQNGNIDLGVYSTAATRAKLFSTGTTACPATGAWRVVGNPNLAVSAGDQLDLVVATDSASASFGTVTGVAAGACTLPTNFWPAANGAAPILSWAMVGGSFPLPATFSEGSIVGHTSHYLVIARVA